MFGLMELLAGVLSLTQAGGGGPGPIEPRCYPARQPITVDGRLDEWDLRGPILIGSAEQRNLFEGRQISKHWEGPGDASALIYLAYDEEQLYIAGEVRDDLRLHNDQIWWNGDCLELFLDVDRDGDRDQALWNDDDYQICLMPYNQGRPWGVSKHGRSSMLSDGGLHGLEVAYRPTEAAGYIFELRLPLGNFPSFQIGHPKLGFNLAVHDHDRLPDGSLRHSYLTINGTSNNYADTSKLLELVFVGEPILKNPVEQKWLGRLAPWMLSILIALVVIVLVAWVAWPLFHWVDTHLRSWRRLGLGLILFVLFVVFGAPLLVSRFLEWRVSADFDARAAVVGRVVADLADELQLHEGRGLEDPVNLLALLRGRPVEMKPLHDFTCFELRPRESDPNLRRSLEGVPVRSYGFEVPAAKQLSFLLPEPMVLSRLFLFGLARFREQGRGRPGAQAIREQAVEIGLRLIDGSERSGLFPAVDRGLSTGFDIPASDRHTLAFEDGDRLVEQYFLGAPTVGDTLVTAVTISLRDPDIEFHLEGVTYARAGAESELEPLSLAHGSLAGPPAALWNGFPQNVQVNLAPRAGSNRIVVPLGKRLDSVYLFYSTTDPRVLEPGLSGVEVARVSLDRAGSDPIVVPLRAGVNILFGMQDPSNRPAEAQSRLAYQWETGGGNVVQIEMLEIPLPPRSELTDLVLENLGPLAGISLFAVTGGTLAGPVRPQTGSVLLDEGGSLRVQSELAEVIQALDLAVFRGGQLAELDFLDSGLKESLKGAPFPLSGSKSEPDGVEPQRAVLGGELYLVRAFDLGREEGEQLTVAAAAKVHGLSMLRRTQRQLGFFALALIIPLLMFYVLDGATRIARLRLRLTTLLVATSLAPIVILFGVLYNVVSNDRARLRETQGAAAMREVRTRLLGLYGQTQRIPQEILGSEVVRGILSGGDLDRERLESYLQEVAGLQASPGMDLAVRLEVELPDGQRLRFHDRPGFESASRFDRSESGIRYHWGRLLLHAAAERSGAERRVKVVAAGAILSEVSAELGRATATRVSLLSLSGFPIAGGWSGDSKLRAGDLESIQKQGSTVFRVLSGGELVATDLLRAPKSDPAALIEVILPPDSFLLDVFVGRMSLETFFFWLCVLTLGVAVFMGAVATWRITAPVLELEGAARRIARGDLDVEVETGSRGEVGRLASSFNIMTKKLKHRAAEQARLERAMAALTSSMEPSAAASAALSALAEDPPADSCVLYRVDAVRDRLQRLGSPLGNAQGFPLTLTVGPRWEQLLHRGEARILAADDPTNPPPESVRLGTPLALILPLTLSGRTMGVAILRYGEQVGADDLHGALPILQHLAGQISVALENARLYGLAVADPLTGLYVGSYFENRLAEEVDRAEHQGSRLSLVRIELEDLERIERSLGRVRRREAILRVARVIRSEAREMYLVARTGGSFLVLMPETGARLGAEFRQRLLDRIEQLRSGTGDLLRVSAQGGVATFPEDGRSTAFLLDAAATDLAGSRRRTVRRALAAGEPDAETGGAGKLDVHPYIFQSAVMRELLDQVARVAPSQASVLILGETGTGKEVVAELLHRWSDRAHRPFLALNCSAVPENLLEAELFGFEKGAFTGAVRSKPGRLEEAHGGTLLLDEVGDMPRAIQAKLLRVLQDQQIVRLGGRRPRMVDVRVLAATNRDLSVLIEEGEFRSDLYFRLKVVSLTVPRLSERREDIPVLVDHFIREFNRENSRSLRGVSPAALDRLYRYDWPGNIRELRNVLDRAMLLSEGNLVLPASLRFEATDFARTRAERPGTISARSGDVPTGGGRPVGVVGEEELNERQRRLLSHLGPEETIRSREYFELVGVSPRTGLRDLNDLMERGLIIRMGRRRAAIYRLAEGT